MLSRFSVGNIASSVRNIFSDLFSSRANTITDLGTSTDGSKWKAINGTLQVVSGAAKSTTTPTIISATLVSGGAAPTSGGGGGGGSFSGNATAPFMVVDNATGIAVNQRVTGRGVAPDTYVTGVNGTTITVSQSFLSGGASGTILFLSASASEYSMATQNMPTQNNIIEIKSAGEGAAAAIWVQSSSDWWMVGLDSIRNTIPGTYFTYTNPGTYTPGHYFSIGVPGSPPLTGTNPPTFTPGNTVSGTNPTTYSFSQYLRISRSIASIVNTVTSLLVSTVSVAQSLRVTLNSNQITARAFSDTNLVTQLGSDLVYTATGAAINTQYGIAISPSAYQQSAIIGTSVTITRN